MDWPPLINSVIMAALGAITILAYKHPHAFQQIAGPIFFILIPAFLGSLVWNEANKYAREAITPLLKAPLLASSQFGGALSGALRPRKWYFFFAPELRREREGVTVTSTVPTASEKTGDFSASPLVIYDPLSIHSIGVNIFARNPFPQNRIPTADIPLPSRDLISLYPNPPSPRPGR